MKKIFVAGASGFIGKSLVKYLKEKKYKVVSASSKKKANNLQIDFTKEIKLKKKIDWIVHIAAHHKIEDFAKYSKVKAKRNVAMTRNLMNFAKKNKIYNYIFFSTIDINFNPFPPLKNIYIKSKINSEKYLINEFKKKKLKNIQILRLPAVVGKMSGNNFIKNLIKNLCKNKEVTIWNQNNYFNNLVHINDLNRLIFFLISGKSKKNNKIIDCVSSKPIKLKSLVINLKKKLKSKSNIKFLKMKNYFKKIKFNSKTEYNFFSVKKAISLLT